MVAEVVGSFDLAFSTADERLNASGPAGDTTSVPLVIRNDGTAPLNRVTLSATPPTDWEGSFEPKGVDHVAPGDTIPASAKVVSVESEEARPREENHVAPPRSADAVVMASTTAGVPSMARRSSD